jgi:hypothetical protein
MMGERDPAAHRVDLLEQMQRYRSYIASLSGNIFSSSGAALFIDKLVNNNVREKSI